MAKLQRFQTHMSFKISLLKSFKRKLHLKCLSWLSAVKARLEKKNKFFFYNEIMSDDTHIAIRVTDITELNKR